MAFRFKLRRNTAGGWSSLNPVLLDGEPGLESAVGVAPDKIKYGDGVTAWNDLPYSGDELGNVAAEAAARAAGDAALASDIAALSASTTAGLTGHLSDTADAHDASAVSFVPTGGIAATDVQAALAELAGGVTVIDGGTA